MDELEPLAYRPSVTAKLLNCSEAQLEKMRREGRGPVFVRPEGGRSIYYTREELLRWLHSREAAELKTRVDVRVRSRKHR